MDRRAAEEIVPILYNTAKEITRAMRIYQRCTPVGQTEPFTDAIGRVMNEIYELILPMVRGSGSVRLEVVPLVIAVDVRRALAERRSRLVVREPNLCAVLLDHFDHWAKSVDGLEQPN